MNGRILGIAVAAAAVAPALAQAQVATSLQDTQSAFQRDRNISVRNRPRPDLDALGIRSGAFLLYPKVEISEAYEDNIFASETNEQHDTVTSLAPSVALVSQWSRHELQAFARGNVYRYNDFGSQDGDTYAIGASGRFDIQRGSWVSGSARFDHLVEPRTSQSTPQNALDPVRYDQASVDLGAQREFNRFRVNGQLRFRDYRFDNTVDFNGLRLDQSYRDNTSVEAQGRIDYAVSPALALYATGLHSDWNFKRSNVAADVNRDASGNQVAVGADFELTNLVRGQVQAGYLKQTFDDKRVKDIDGLGVLAQVEYFPTQLLTMTFNAERSAQATGVFSAAGIAHTSGSVQADYELRRNLILSAKAQRFSDDYRGVDRTDDVWTAMLGAYLLVNRRVGVNVIYNYYNQDSSGAARGPDFASNRIQLGFVLQY